MRRIRSSAALALVVASVLASSCTTPAPPSVPPPTLPGGVGVQWVRDVGGTYDPVTGDYAPAYDRYSVLDGTVTGPTPVGSGPVDPPPVPNFFGGDRPDGSAKFPYNGFAGEGITMSGTNDIFTLSFPGGNCQLYGNAIEGVYPSPDGTMAAVFDGRPEDDGSLVAIVSLVDGVSCPGIVSEFYGYMAGVGAVARGPIVWAPDSTAVTFSVWHDPDESDIPHTYSTLERLEAATEANPVTVLPATTDDITPLGWSVADRLLVHRLPLAADPGATSITSTLATLSASGGSVRNLSSLTFPLASITRGIAAPFLHYGYFVPGTTSIVMNGFQMVTNTDGLSMPWFQVQLIADATGACAGPILGSPPPLALARGSTRRRHLRPALQHHPGARRRAHRALRPLTDRPRTHVGQTARVSAAPRRRGDRRRRRSRV